MSQLFSDVHIEHTLPTTSTGETGPLYYVAGRGAEDSHIFKGAVYNSTAEVPVSVAFDGVQQGTPAELTVLTASGPFDMNAVGGPNMVNSQVSTVKAGKKGVFDFSLPNLSVATLKTM